MYRSHVGLRLTAYGALVGFLLSVAGGESLHQALHHFNGWGAHGAARHGTHHRCSFDQTVRSQDASGDKPAPWVLSDHSARHSGAQHGASGCVICTLLLHGGIQADAGPVLPAVVDSPRLHHADGGPWFFLTARVRPQAPRAPPARIS